MIKHIEYLQLLKTRLFVNARACNTKTLMITMIYAVIAGLSCQNRYEPPTNSKNYILFHRDIPNDFWRTDMYMINVEQKKEIRLTTKYLNFSSAWDSESLVYYIVSHHRRSSTDADIARINIYTGKGEIFSVDDPYEPEYGLISIFKNCIYYCTYDVDYGNRNINTFAVVNDTIRIAPIISAVQFNDLGIYQVQDPVISPDGKYIVFEARDSLKRVRSTDPRKQYQDLFLYSLGDKSTRKLNPPSDSNYRQAAWIDPENLLFSSNEDWGYKIYSVNIKTSNISQLIDDENYDLLYPAMAPDKVRIAYVKQDRKTYRMEIWIYDLRTGKSEYLTEGDSP